MALEAVRRMEARDVIRILDPAVLERGDSPEFIRSDNGPGFLSMAMQELDLATWVPDALHQTRQSVAECQQ